MTISFLIIVVTFAVAAYDFYIDLLAPALVSAAAGMFIVFSIWIFPDVKPKKNKLEASD